MALEEGAVDWNGAKDFFEGKAAAGEEPAASPENTTDHSDGMVEVRIKGRAVKMTKDAADAYTEFVRETRERDGRLGGEIAQLRERSARLEGMVESVSRAGKPETADGDIQPPPPKLAIENFEEWQRQFLAYHGAMMLRQQAELEGKVTSEQQRAQEQARKAAEQRAWAERFYADHPHLNKPHLRNLVTGVYQRNAQEIETLNRANVVDAHDRLAELAEAEIVAVKADGKRIESESNHRRQPPRLEGAGSPGSGREEAGTFKPTSAADWSARKRAALRGEKRK